MEKYVNSALNQIGHPLPGAVVSFEQYPSGTPYTPYSDDGVTPIVGAVTTDLRGFYEVYLDPGQYNIIYSLNNVEMRRITDISIGDSELRSDLLSSTASKGASLVSFESGNSVQDLEGSGGSALVGFLQSGTGAVARTMQDKERDFIHVKDFGAVGDGVTDDASAIQKAIDYAASIGGGAVYLDNRVYCVGSDLSITSSGVVLVGRDAGFFNGAHVPACQIKYTGASGGTVLTIASVSGASNRKITGSGIVGIGIDGNSLADFGVVIRSVNEGFFEFSTTGCVDTHVVINTVAALADARDNQMNDFRYIRVNATGSQNGINIDTDTLGANTSYNIFETIAIAYENGYAIRVGNSDNNTFQQIWGFRAGGGTGEGMIIGAGDGVNNNSARGNLFVRVGISGGGIRSEGTVSGSVEAIDNTIIHLDKENGNSDPVIEAGSTLSWGTNRRILPSFGGIAKLTIADTVSQATTNMDSIGTASLRIFNGSQNHVRLLTASAEYAIDVDGSNNMRFRVVSGGNRFQFSNPVKFVSHVGFYNTDPIAKPTVTGSRGGNAALASALTALASLGLITDSTTA